MAARAYAGRIAALRALGTCGGNVLMELADEFTGQCSSAGLTVGWRGRPCASKSNQASLQHNIREYRMASPVPHDEAARSAALREYRLLDTAPEPAFDDIAALAAHICATPIGLAVLLDEHRQWFKASVGLEVRETPREHAFCSYAVLKPDSTMVVEDARADARFAQNPMVTAAPHIRFYAGAPLVNADGIALGTLCVIDRRPRTLSAVQQQLLEALARQLVAQMELRRVSAGLAAALGTVQQLQALLPICAWCRNIRNDAGDWHGIEEHLTHTTGAEMTHSICPGCMAKQRALI